MDEQNSHLSLVYGVCLMSIISIALLAIVSVFHTSSANILGTFTTALAPRGVSGDFWADVEVGKRDFTEDAPREVVAYKVSAPGGTYVDRSTGTGKMYVWDSGNSRILGVDIASCYAGSPPCSASIVLGQPSASDYGACNQDASFQSYPHRGPSSASTLCGIPEWTHTTLEDKTFVSMFTDPSGNLFVPDAINNRVLEYLNPFSTDTVADEVWGQADFSGNKCNRTGDYGQTTPAPTASSLCFFDVGAGGAGVTLDAAGNLWVADAGNNRVLRFPVNPVTHVIGKTADLVLGQANFTSGGDYSYGSAMNRLSSPAAVRFDANGILYVADTGNNRVLKFTPPFSNGMNATSTFGSYTGGLYNLEIDPTGAGIWTFENQGYYPTPKLWDFSGNLLKTLQQLGNPGGGSVGIDAQGNLYLSTYVYGQDVTRYEKQPDSSYILKNTFQPPWGYNLTTSRRFEHGAWEGVAVSSSQLYVTDGRLLFWNNPPASITNGKTPDGYAGASTFTDFGNYSQIQTDSDNRLWAPRNNTLEIYQTPLASGQQPFKTLTSPFTTVTGQQVTVSYLSGVAPAPHGEYVWVTDTDNHRVLRISNPLSADPRVDVILGQTTVSGNQCNRGIIPQPNSGTSETASLDMLCYPGAIALDKFENLYVSDHFIEAVGNWRLLMFSASTFPSAPASVLFAPSASKSFPRAGVQSHATFQPAFDSTNRMVVGYNPYLGPRFIEYYNHPTDVNPADPSDPNYALPDGHLNDFYGWPVAMAFDSHDNLYAFDNNRGRVNIYLHPFPYPSDTTPPTTSVTAPADNATLSGTVNVTATAADNVAVTKVEIYVDNNLKQTYLSGPFVYNWNTTVYPHNTAHTLMSKAYDAAGNSTTSTVVHVTVQDITPPQVVITSPANGIKSAQTAVTIAATITDASAISRVEFSVNNVIICTDSSLPFSCGWTIPVAQGVTYSIQAKAFDAAGNSAFRRVLILVPAPTIPPDFASLNSADYVIVKFNLLIAPGINRDMYLKINKNN